MKAIGPYVMAQVPSCTARMCPGAHEHLLWDCQLSCQLGHGFLARR